MYTYQNADAGPHITPASRWLRGGAVFLGTLVLIGVAGSLYAKKPVKPPPEPEPPPITESGLLYFQADADVQVIDMASAGWAPTTLFTVPTISLGTEYLLDTDPMPSVLDHSGRWFVSVQYPVIIALNEYGYELPYALYGYPAGASPYGENSFVVSPFLVAIDETGAATRLNSEDDLYEIDYMTKPQWYAGDTRILFFARKVVVTARVPATTPESKWNPEPESYIKTYLAPVAESAGLYIAKISWIDGAPVLDEPPALLEWSRRLWSDDEFLLPESFAVSQDGSVVYVNKWEEQQVDYSLVLHRIDLQTGENEEVLATDFSNVALNTGETRIYGSGSDPNYPFSVIRYIGLQNPGPPVTIEPPSEKLSWAGPIVAPSDQTLVFRQSTKTGRYLRNPEIGISDLSGTATGVVYDENAYLLGWRSAP